MEFKIVATVEKPATRRGRNGKGSTYPFAQMTVGGAFKYIFTSDDPAERDKISRRIRTAALSFAKTHKEYHFETWTGLKSNGLEQDQDGDGIWVRRIADSKRTQNVENTTHTNGLATGAALSA